METVIGTIAGILCAFSFLPQVIKIIKTKRTQDLSLLTFSAFCGGVFLWFVYGILISSAPITIANAVTLIIGLIILIMKLKYK